MTSACPLKMTGLTDPKDNFSFTFTKTEMKVVSVDANKALVTYKLEEKGGFMGQPFPPVVYATTI